MKKALILFLTISAFFIFTALPPPQKLIFLLSAASAQTNNPPPTPKTPTPPSQGTVGTLYYFSSTLYPDPDGSSVQAVFDFGDGSPNFTSGLAYPPSFAGMSFDASHSWSSAGTYSIKVKAVDSTGLSSSWSSSATITIGAPPNPPTPAATANGNNVTITWTSGSPNVTGFKIYRTNPNGSVTAPGPGDWGSTIRSYTDTNVPDGTYSYYMQAYSGGGGTPMFLSSNSNIVRVTVSGGADTTAPSTPTGLSATAISSSQINLTWTASTDDVGVAGYKIYRSGSQIATVSSSTSYADTGLFYANNSYTYNIAAYDAAGNISALSSSVTASTLAPIVSIPTAPSGLAFSGSSPTSIGIYWSDNSIDESEFRIERRFNSGSWSLAGSVAGTPTTKATTNVNTFYTDNSLNGAGTYEYRVKACNSSGCSAESSIISRTIDAAAPATPSNLTASARATSITVDWTDNSTSEWGFRLYRRAKGDTSWFGVAAVFNNGTGNFVSYSDTYQLRLNTIYEYVVRSYNTYESVDSNMVTVNFGTTSATDTPPTISAFVKSANELQPTTIFAGLRAYISITITDDNGIASAGFNAPGLKYSSADVTLSQCAKNIKNCSEPIYIIVPDKPGSYTITVNAKDSVGQTASKIILFTAQGCVADSECGGQYFPSSGATFCGLTGTYLYDKRMKYQVNSTCAAGSCSESTAPGVLEDCAATGKMCGFSQANGGQFQCVAIPSATCASNTKITSSCKCGPESSDGTAYGYCCVDSSNKPYLSPFVCTPTPVPGAGAPEPSTAAESGTWAQVDIASGKVAGAAICTRAVCGINGEWHGYVPPSSYAVGSVWWPTSKRYIWQLPGQAGYSTGTFNFNTYIFTVQGGTIYNGQFTPTTITSTPNQTINPTASSTLSISPLPIPIPTAVPIPPAVLPAASSTLMCSENGGASAGNICPVKPTPCATGNIVLPDGRCTAQETPIGQCLQAGGLWCYSDFPNSLSGYCAPAKSACKSRETTIPSAIPQPSFVDLRAETVEQKRAEIQRQEQFLTNRRAVLQDLRALERLVKRDIIEINPKQLQAFKDKILSLKSEDEENISTLATYREQITSLQGTTATSSEREVTTDPRAEARALQQLKQGLRLFDRHIATLETKVAQIKKSGITVDVILINTIATAKEMAQQVKKAKSYNEIKDIAEQMPDIGQALNDALPRLEELLRLPGVLRLVNRRITEAEKAIKQADTISKRLKLEVSDTLEIMQTLLTEAKDAVTTIKTSGAGDVLIDTLNDQIFEKLDEIFDLADNIRTVANIRQAVNQLTADAKRYEARLRRVKASKEDTQSATDLISQFKEQLSDLKVVSTQKLTPESGDQIIDHLNTMSELKTDLEEVLHLTAPSALQKQIKQLFSSPSEKIKPFKVEQLEKGVL
ncbi:MAG: PKD domain-containing protein [Candidatus Magasanikbacteria bacterium]|nr:PKD domain-containing protein [Candidatus Magasanikbacteria bacterium]